jgi:nucleoside phosphorylase
MNTYEVSCYCNPVVNMKPDRTLQSVGEYTVGWVAALPLELAAAIAMLDEKHDAPRDLIQAISDKNIYSWGRIGDHKVVLTSLPAGVYGTVSAAVTAQQLLSTFPQIRVGLLVGIGAAIPSASGSLDIRLGDVVVSQPDRQSGGVVQYDLEKVEDGGRFTRKGTLNMPPEALLKALSRLQAHHESNPSRIVEFTEGMLERNPFMAQSKPGRPSYQYQGAEYDRLFEATYTHPSRSDSCTNCEWEKEVTRAKRETTEPAIFYGTIASGNLLVRDVATREAIAQIAGDNCICIEMEAAGLMNNFPCLVIRGICDYADSHKNDR